MDVPADADRDATKKRTDGWSSVMESSIAQKRWFPRPSDGAVRKALHWLEHVEHRATVEHVEVVDVETLTYDDFFLDYMVKNVPVVVRGATDNWKCRQEWVDANGQPNLPFLREKFGNGQAFVHRKDKQTGQDQVERCRFDEFLHHWESDEKDPWYWKDWHFVAEFSEYGAYECPMYFQDDWLNHYFDMIRCNSTTQNERTETSDYRFVYMGQEGTKTDLHTDVAKSYSWSANVCGQKEWLLLPPPYAGLLQDQYGRGTATTFDDDPTIYPNLERARDKALQVYQEAGDIIFVPSGWYHSVENTKDTISINHNWFNAVNLHWIASYVDLEEAQAEKAIEDCRELSSTEEFQQLVQQNVYANIGINKPMLAHIVDLAVHERSSCNTVREHPPARTEDLTIWHRFLEVALHNAKGVTGSFVPSLEC